MTTARRAISSYQDPQQFRFAGAMEGVPEYAAAAPASATSGVPRWRAAGQTALDAAARLLPGAALAGLLAFAAVAASAELLSPTITARSVRPPARSIVPRRKTLLTCWSS